MNHDGFYVPINCLEHFYSELMDDLFGCEIDPNFMTEYEFSQDYIRIQGPDGKIYYAVEESDDEEFHPLVIEDPVMSLDGESMLIEWATLWSHTAEF